VTGRLIATMSSPAAPPIGNAGVMLLAVTWVLFVVALVVVCLRLYADILIVRQIRLDSYLTFFTFVRFALFSSCTRAILIECN